MRISEILIGVAEGHRTLRWAPREEGLMVLRIPERACSPASLVLALLEVLARPTRGAAAAEVPFIRLTLKTRELEVSVADDATRGERVLMEGRPGALPLFLEARERDGERGDANRDVLLEKVALAAGAADPELLFIALGAERQVSMPSSSDEDLEVRAFVDAHRRALALAREVRALDDAMTASVVPDWLWIATGLGGVGVLMTVVALLYPEGRVMVLPALVALSLIGFGSYARLSLRELRERGRILEARRELRVRREAARAEARSLGTTLTARGLDTEQLLSQAADMPLPPHLPCICSRASLDPDEAERLATLARGRQVIVLVPDSAVIAERALDAVVAAETPSNAG